MKNDDSEKLSCPKCMGFLETKEVGEMEKHGIFIDQCALCHGIWFDKGELAKVLKLKLDFDDESAEDEFHQDWKNDYFDLKKANCPRCKKEMQRVNCLQDDRVIADYCLECDGAWLDGGEIRELMRGGPLHRGIQVIFKKLAEPFQNLSGNK